MKLLILAMVCCLVLAKKKHHQVPSITHVVTPKGGERRSPVPAPNDYLALDILDSNGETHRENVGRAMYDDASFQQLCLIRENAYFSFCSMLSDCAVCAQTKYCGWCGASKKCLPGQLDHAACPGDCLQGWVFDNLHKSTCNIKEGQAVYNSGRLDNVAPESLGMVKALITMPKIKVHNIEKTMRPMKIHYPIGTMQQKTQTYYTDHKGMFNSEGTYSKKNVDKNIVVQVPLNEHVTDTYYDADTNELLNPAQPKVTHALDQ